MNKFYYGIGWGNDLKIPANRILVSAASMYKRKKFIIPEFSSRPDEIMFDWGGYSWLSKNESCPFSPMEYWKFVKDFISVYPQTKYVAMMDYPCLSNTTGTMSNYCRINASIQNFRELIKLPIDSNWMTVVQGYKKSEYSYCTELLHRFDLYTPLTAIGSVCQRKNTGTIKDIIQHVISKNNTVKYHAFGLQLRALLDENTKQLLESSDSHAWRFFSGNKPGKNIWKPRNLDDCLENFYRYKIKIEEQILQDFRYRNLAETV